MLNESKTCFTEGIQVRAGENNTTRTLNYIYNYLKYFELTDKPLCTQYLTEFMLISADAAAPLETTSQHYQPESSALESKDCPSKVTRQACRARHSFFLLKSASDPQRFAVIKAALAIPAVLNYLFITYCQNHQVERFCCCFVQVLTHSR